jgi:dolichyl-diphosphooligosaccharide--protein glycosyltransferase
MKKYILLAFTLAAVLGLNIYFRLFPAYFPQFKAQARDIIGQRIRWNIKQDIEKKFPELDDLAKQSMVKTNLYQYYKFKKAEIDRAIKTEYVLLKERFQDERGQTYLMELDCWHWARYVENVVKTGHPGDQTVGGKQFDLFMLAPQGSYMLWDQFLFYLSAFLYKGFSLFKKVELFDFLFYLPLLFAAVFIAVLYMFSFRLGRHIAAVISCLFVGLSPIFLPRSCAGWFDKDILNLLFPLLVVWTYVLAYSAYSLKRRLLWVFFSSFWVGIFCFTWTHWWFIFLIIIGYEIISLAYIALMNFYFKRKDPDSLRQHAICLACFVLFSFLWILILAGPEPLVELYRQIKLALILNKPLMSSIWPNVYSTVGELRKLDFQGVSEVTGGVWIFIPSVLSLLIVLVRILRNRKYVGFKREAVIILAIWFVSMVFASTRGIRFVVFILIPLGISLGWLINEVYEYFRSKRQVFPVVLILAAVIALSGIFINRGYRAAGSIYPLMDDIWYQLLNLIKEKTPDDAILNSWWDYGDWFKVVARRRVIFDGQSQDSPQAYWMAKALLSSNENESVAILRMLNNGGNRAFEVIDKHIKDPLKSAMLLESLLTEQPEKVEVALSEFLPLPARQEVMRLLFNNPKAKSCFIVDNTMVPKMGAISYLGNWDFSKVYIAQNFNKKEKDEIIEHLDKLGRDDRMVQQFYQEAFLITTKNLDDWLSSRKIFYSDLISGVEKEGVVFFPSGFFYDIKSENIGSNNGQIPRSFFIISKGTLLEKVIPNPNVIFSVFVYKTEEGYKSILLDRELAGSLFVRLYFFNGAGSKYFVPFINAQDGNNYIRVFNISW